MGAHNGKRYAAPMSGETVAPWVGKPSEGAVEAEKVALLALVAWAPVTGDNVTARTVEITGPIGPCGIEAEATGEREEGRQEERARAVARLERFCREAPTDQIGFACHFAVAVQDIRSGKGE